MTSPISARRARRTRGQWSQLVREQAASSVSQQAFCRQHDLGLSTFIKWKRQFNGVSPSSVKPVGFVELPVGGSVSQPSGMSVRRAQPVVALLPPAPTVRPAPFGYQQASGS